MFQYSIAKNNVWLNRPSTNILLSPRQICPQNALDIIRAVLAGGWTSRSLQATLLSFLSHSTAAKKTKYREVFSQFACSLEHNISASCVILL